MPASVKRVAGRWLNAGNPSSLYKEGRAAKAAIDEAREIVSDRLDVSFGEVIFTSSGTESAGLALLGAALGASLGASLDGSNEVRRKVIFSEAEHHCVLNTRPQLEALGFEVALAPVDRYARVDLVRLGALLGDKDVLIVAAMHANNELGSLNPVQSIGDLCKAAGALFFCDAVQTFGKIPFTARDLNADLISLSAHKFGGPKGAGAVYIKAGTPFKPVFSGGGQERELRGGTENVAGIAGLAEAVRQIPDSLHRESLAPSFRRFLVELGAVETVSAEINTLENHVHVRFPGVYSDTFLILLDRLGVSAGSGAACSSGSLEPSHVLLACGYTHDQSKEGLRFTLGPSTTAEEIQFAQDQIATAIDQIRRKPQ
jgi:cysteine desulfurase